MGLTIGIPSKGVDESLMRAIKHAQSLNVDQILVGINPGNSVTSELYELEDPRVRVIFYKEDLGLYGNFRYLASRAEETFFAWLCTDDAISPEVPEMVRKFENTNVNLIIPSWVWAEYHPGSNDPFDLANTTAGVYPDLHSIESIIDSALMCEPSWIFGVWRTNFLNNVFPKRNFDWLDTFLLQKALLTSLVTVYVTDTPTIIGTWNWANKVPRPVSSRGHNPFLAIVYQIMLLPTFIYKHPRSISDIWKRLVFLLRQSRYLNLLLAEKGLK